MDRRVSERTNIEHTFKATSMHYHKIIYSNNIIPESINNEEATLMMGSVALHRAVLWFFKKWDSS